MLDSHPAPELITQVNRAGQNPNLGPQCKAGRAPLSKRKPIVSQPAPTNPTLPASLRPFRPRPSEPSSPKHCWVDSTETNTGYSTGPRPDSTNLIRPKSDSIGFTPAQTERKSSNVSLKRAGRGFRCSAPSPEKTIGACLEWPNTSSPANCIFLNADFDFWDSRLHFPLPTVIRTNGRLQPAPSATGVICNHCRLGPPLASPGTTCNPNKLLCGLTEFG